MPEGVEVKLSADLIRPLVIGKCVRKLILGNKSRYANTSPEGYKDFNNSFREDNGTFIVVSAVKVVDVNTKGKFMYWTFDNDWYMFSTFGMTGQWSPDAGKHVCLEMSLYDDQDQLSEMYYNDPRHFGTLKFTNSKQELDDKLNDLGWDPLRDQYTKYQSWLKSLIIKTNKPVGQLLMDQGVFAGVGNYIRAEALYLSRISPWRQGKQMSESEVDALCKSIIIVMEDSYKHQGATIQTYKTAYGAEGKYSSCFQVYGKKSDPLGNKIIKEDTPDGRTIHWCPTMQA